MHRPAYLQMILNKELEFPPPRVIVQKRWNELFDSSRARMAFVFILFFAVAVLLQVLSGAYHSEFGGYPDEPAHYVTSLMVREYVTAMHPFSPMRFAENYYLHYPKVAFGHWPPLLYVIQAFWMMLFSQARASVLLELAATTTLLAYAVYSEARRWFTSTSLGSTAALLAGLLTICLPLMQVYTDEEMAESLLILLCFWSAIFFARYIDSERWQDSFWFGIFFALAVLTKGSGWLLVLVPPVALLLTRKLRLLLRPGFWISALIVAVLCIPWQLATLHMAERGWTGGTTPSAGYTFTALWQFLVAIEHMLGPALSVLLVVGLLAEIFRKRIAPHAATMFAFIFAVWLFHSIVPAGVEDRKMLIALPALVLFIFAGGFWIAGRLPLRGSLARWGPGVVAAAAALLFLFQTFAIPHEKHYGYIEAARFLTTDPQMHDATILVSSQSVGEGLLISEIAMREPLPQDTILRATKSLAQVDWNDDHYRSLFSTPAQLLHFLDRSGVNVVVLDTFPGEKEFTHHNLLRRTIAQFSRQFQRLANFQPGGPQTGGEVDVYRFERTSGAAH